MTPLFQNRPTGRRIALVAWQKFLGAFAAMPVLFLVSAGVFVLLALGVQYAGQKLDITDPFLDGMESSDAWFYVARTLAMIVLGLPIALATCRFVLQDETGAGLASSEGRAFSLWAVGLGAASLGLLYVRGLITGLPSTVAPAAVLMLIAVALPLGCVMIFPDLAAGAPARSVSGRIENSLSSWSGNILLFLRAAAFALGPIILPVYFVQKAIANRGGQAVLDRVHAGQTWLLATAALTPLGIALAMALVSSFYAGARAPKA